MQFSRSADDGLDETERRDRAALGCVNPACQGVPVQTFSHRRGRVLRQALRCLNCGQRWIRNWID